MSKTLELQAYKHNSRCDIQGCRNTATQSLGDPRVNAYNKINICPECLQTIVNIVPLDMIMKRPGVKEYLKIQEAEGHINHIDDIVFDDKEKLSSLPYKDLKDLAKEKGLEIPYNIKKDDLITKLMEKSE